MKILYVEDEIPHVELTQRALEDNLKEDFVLYHRESIAEAIELLNSDSKIDVVLTDYRLPDGTGMDLLKKVHQLPIHPAVVLVTGQGDEQVAVTALKAGAADYLVKQSDYLHRLPIVISNAVIQNKLQLEQAAKQEAEIRYQALVERIPAVVFMDDINEEQTTIYMSPGIEELTGYTSDEWRSDSLIWEKNIHPEDIERIIHRDKESEESGERFIQEYRFIRKDGQIVWIKEDTSLIRDKSGTPLYWQGIFIDITKEIEAQTVLKASEERFRQIFHSTPIPTCVVTQDEGRFLDANNAFQKLTGKTLEELVGHTSNDLHFWKSAADREKFLKNLTKSGYLRDVEIQFINVPNGPKDTLAYYELLDLGNTTGILAMFYDITEQKKAQKALLAERDFALQILNNMGQGLVILNEEGEIEYANPAFANILDHKINEIIGKTSQDFSKNESKEKLLQERGLRKQGVSSIYEISLIKKNNDEVPVIITGVPRLQNGKITGTISVVTDLTLQKQSERALARQIKELKTLHAATVAGAESISEDEIISSIVEFMIRIYDEVCGVLLLDPTEKILVPHSSYYGADVSNWRRGTPLTQGITGRVVLEGREIRIGDVSKSQDFIEIASNIKSELCVPIRVNKRIIGVINIESRKLDAFDEEDERFLITIANTLGSAIERLRLFKEEQRRAKELDALYTGTKALTQSLDVKKIAENLLATMDGLLDFEYSSIYLLSDSSETLSLLALNSKAKSTDIYDGENANKFLESRQLGEGIIGWVAQHGQPIRTGNVHKEPHYVSVIKNINSELCVPLETHGKIIGALNIETTKPNAYTENDENLLTALASSAAIAFENAKLYLDAVMASERRAVLHRLSQDIVRFNQNPEQIYQAIHDATRQLMKCDVFMISLTINAKDKINYVYTVEGDQVYTLENAPINEGLTGRVYESNKSIILPNEDTIQQGNYSRFGSPQRVKSAIAVPMLMGSNFLGIISAQSYENNSYGPEEQTLLEMLASHATTAIDNMRLYNETKLRLKEMETINRVSSTLRNTQSQEDMINILLDEALLVLETEHGSVWMYNIQDDILEQRVARGMAALAKKKKLNRSQGMVGHVFSNTKIYLSQELASDPIVYTENKPHLIPGIGGVAIPIHSTAGILGVVTVQLEMKRLAPEQINLLNTLAEITGNAIHRADLFDQSQEQIRKLVTLRDIDSAINSSTDLRVTLNLLVEHTLKHLKVDATDILLYHPELQSLSYYCSAGFMSPSPSRPMARINEGLCGNVIMNSETVIIHDLNEYDGKGKDQFIVREKFIAYVGVPVVVKGHIKGVFEIFNRTPLSISNEWMDFLHTLAGQAAIAIDNSQLFDNLQKSNDDLKRAYDTTLEGWARALELRDRETEGHTRRVTELTMELAKYMGVFTDDLENIYRGVLLHDIGKMGVPDHILRKTGPLTDDEWVEMRKHPQYAFDLLSPIQYLRPALDIPYCHHEHWDGSGYPRGLKGEAIPLAARIFSVVDIWDALLSNRPYRNAWPRQKAIEYLIDISGKQLDPKVVEMFLKMVGEEDQKTG